MNPLRLIKMPVEHIAAGVTGKYSTQGKLSDADCVIGFSFGYRGKDNAREPGLSNQDLANTAIQHYSKLPKIFQSEITDAYTASGGPKAQEIHTIATRKSTSRTLAAHDLDTREVAVQAKAIMERQGYKTAVLLAHPYHMPRVELVCSKLGIAWVATPDERGAIDFDPLSSQKWTRDLDSWRGYEPLAMTYYRLKGWV